MDYEEAVLLFRVCRQLPAGPVEYREFGQGRPVVFIHGALVNHQHWRKVAAALAPQYRCIFPTLPLGAHSRPMRPNADLSLRGLADLLDGFLAGLSLEDVTLVGNDTGGGICQMMTAHHPERVGSVVLLPSDAFKNAPPPILAYLHYGAYLPGFCWALSQGVRLKAVRNLRGSPRIRGRRQARGGGSRNTPLPG